ncbi:MAG: hypothetical protein AAF841_05810 [Pseudomonadota bacterium]
MFRLTIFLLLVPLALSAQDRPAPPQGPSELYFLSVGIGEYHPATPGEDLRGAENSARLVAEALVDAGARGGILLTSNLDGGETERMVTREDMLTALFDLKRMIRRDGARAPRIVFYAMGHGYGAEDMRGIFLMPGNYAPAPRHLTQTGIASLINHALWDVDLLASQVFFRTDESMRHFDDFEPSEMIPDPDDFLGSMIRIAERQGDLLAIDAQRRRDGAYAYGGNPPVPFIALFDNCGTSIRQDLLIQGGPLIQGLTSLMSDFYAEFTNEGRAIYAAPPGQLALDVRVPDRFGGEGRMGPLALRFLDVIAESPKPVTLAGFEAAMRADSDLSGYDAGWAPFLHPGEIVGDTRDIELLPASSSDKSFEHRFGTGQEVER